MNDHTDKARAALLVIDRLEGQRHNSTPRRDRFTMTRQELAALSAAKGILRLAMTESARDA